MPFQPVPETLEAVLRYTQNNQLCTLTFYGRFPGYTQGTANALAIAMNDWAVASFKPNVCTSVFYTAFSVRGLGLINDVAALATGGAGAGTAPGAPSANQDCIAIKRISALTGRSARGRVYWPLNSLNIDVNEDMVTLVAALAFVTALNAVRATMLSVGISEVIVSRRTNNLPRLAGITFPVVNYINSDLIIDSQRRRMPGR